MSTFEKLSKIDVGQHIEKKGKLSYLSWAWAWAEFKKVVPNGNYKVYENAQGLNYHNDNNSAWVKVGVIADDLEHIEYLPVMDFKNKSIPLGNVTSMDVNKAIQRALTKAIARHGLGLYIYAGEDLPEAPPIENINQEQVLELVKLIADAQTTMEKVLTKLNWGITRLEDIQVQSFQIVKDLLNKQIEILKGK